MTELQSATIRDSSDSYSDNLVSPSTNSGGNLVEETQTEISLDLRYDLGSVGQQNTDSEINGGLSLDCSDGEENEDTDEEPEPLGYHQFLYDVKIEYNLGGNRSCYGSHEHCFKMKPLPYMVGTGHIRRPTKTLSNYNHTNNDGSSSDNTMSCDQGTKDDQKTDCNISDTQPDLGNLMFDPPVDVSKTTCAFLSNSDYVPNLSHRQKRVVIELVSAKLSHNNYNSLASASSSNMTNLIDLAENSTIHNQFESSITSSVDSTNSRLRTTKATNVDKEQPPVTTSSSSSRKFVNYTILIRTVPGLDHQPAVIERRFSDFLSLYQDLKSNKNHAKIVDEFVKFPKKVYMGNFTVAKIAERSVEFMRLLYLCMRKPSLTYSVPFASFLIDKELKEAHRLSLYGDPDDVQTLIETVYHIIRKLYTTSSSGDSSASSSRCSANLTCSYAQQPNGFNSDQDDRDRTTEAIGYKNHGDERCIKLKTTSIGPINQRLLVAYCMLLIVYCRSHNNLELKQVVGEFNQLISSQDFIDSLIVTRHYYSLRACLLFLVNLNQGDVIDENLRSWLMRKLGDIDGSFAELTNTTNGADEYTRTQATNEDLTSLLRERNFCTFQDNIK